MPNVTRLVRNDREKEIEERAAPIIKLAMARLAAFAADSSGRVLERFLRDHATKDAEVDTTVRSFVDYSLALSRGRRLV